MVDEIDTEDHQSFFLAASNKIGNTILSHIKALCGTFFHVYMHTTNTHNGWKIFLAVSCNKKVRTLMAERLRSQHCSKC